MDNKFGHHWQTGVARDVQEAIRNFLKLLHRHWNTQWCLLSGDINIVPVRHVLGNESWYSIPKEDKLEPDEGNYYIHVLQDKMPLLSFRSMGWWKDTALSVIICSCFVLLAINHMKAVLETTALNGNANTMIVTLFR